MNIQAFSFQSTQVRVQLIDGEPWFVLADVCKVLEIGNPSDAARRLDEDEKDALDIIDPIGRPQTATIINESGLYSLILTSRKPEAKAFKKWVTAEVLPTIRKTGSYSLQPAQPALPQTYLEALKELVVTTEQLMEKEQQVNQLQAKVLEDEPKVEAYEQVISAGGALCIQQVAHALGWNPNKFYKQLREDGYLMDKRTAGKGRHNLPYACHVSLFEVKVAPWEKGGFIGVSSRVFVTGKGFDKLRKRYCKGGK